MKTKLIFAVIVLAYSAFWIGATFYTQFDEMILKIGGAFTVGFLIFAAVIYVRLLSGERAEGKGTYHGSAGFAEGDEINELAVSVDEPFTAGAFALAPLSDKDRIDLPRKIATRHVALFGPSGAGKSFSFFIPNCTLTKDSSFVATDPKGELWDRTSGFHQNPIKYAPRNPEASAGFNWIPLCSDPHLTLLLARAVMQSDGPSKGKDEFWIYAESAFLAAVFAHGASLPKPTPATIYYFLVSHSGTQLVEALQKSPSDVARQFANIFAQTDTKLRGSIVIAVMTRLMFLADPVIRQFTSAELDSPDFGKLRRNPTAMYWVLQENDVSTLRPLSALFFTLLLYQLKQAEPHVPITLYLDEFANIGRIPDFATEITVARGRDIAFVLGIQSIAQTEALYEAAPARTILENCQTKIAMPGLSFGSAELISRELGDATIMIPRWTTTTNDGFNQSESFTLADSKRRLLTPDEVRRLSEDELLVISTNRRPLFLKRFNYTGNINAAEMSALGNEQATLFNPPPEAKPTLPPPIPTCL